MVNASNEQFWPVLLRRVTGTSREYEVWAYAGCVYFRDWRTGEIISVPSLNGLAIAKRPTLTSQT